MDHSYEEIRNVALDILAGREKVGRDVPSQFGGLEVGIAEVFRRREHRPDAHITTNEERLSARDQDLSLEVFWDLFRQGIITLGYDRNNREFPFFRVSHFGTQIMQSQNAYFFHDVSTYRQIIEDNVPDIDDVTLVYLQEAMQAFMSGCILSASVMLGVATEHTFLILLESMRKNPTHSKIFHAVSKEETILRKVNKFRNLIGQQVKTLPQEIKEDLDTNFAGILSVIRNFRNESGHPTGKIITREQVYVLLNLFVPYCKKMYQLKKHFGTSS